MSAELIRDLDRPSAWWLLVDGSEQSFVDVDDPGHLEFEYLQLVAHVLDSAWPSTDPLDALHLGGGLCTLPRWMAMRHPGSRQLIAERSAAIAAMARRLGEVPGTELVETDASRLIAECPDDSADLVVCDVYEGPETVTALFTLAALAQVRRVLRGDGYFVCNLSDASPFALAKVVVATVREAIGPAVLLTEPAVLRGRRSGNLVLAAGQRPLPIAELVRRAVGGPVRSRVISGEDLAAFVGDARPAADEALLPVSGESLGVRWQ